MTQAVYIRGRRDVGVAPFTLREGRVDEILLEVAAVGLCGSDLHYYKDGGIGSAVIGAPFVPGHEFGGTLTQDDATSGLKRGALVAVDPNQACGGCEWCRAQHFNLCPNVVFIGAPPNDGAMTGRIWVPRSQLVPVPASFSALQTAMLEPLGVAIHAVDLAKPRLLEPVAVLGCGPIGLLIIQVLKVAGCGTIHAVDPLPHRRALAARLGASNAGSAVAEVVERTAGGAPLVVEATNAPEGFRDAVAAARIGGRIVLVGIPDGDTYTLSASQARRRGLKIKFARRMGDVYSRAIALVATDKVDVAAVVSHRVELSEAPGAFAALADDKDGYAKVMIYPNGKAGERS